MVLKRYMEKLWEFFEEKWRLYNYRILEIETKKKYFLQGFCHLLSITKSSLNMDYVWHMLFGLCHTGYQQHIKCPCLNSAVLRWASINYHCGCSFPLKTSKLSFRVASIPADVCLCRKGKDPKWTPQLSSTKSPREMLMRIIKYHFYIWRGSNVVPNVSLSIQARIINGCWNHEWKPIKEEDIHSLKVSPHKGCL